MATGYMDRVTQGTPTRFWVNNPSGEEMEWALGASAISCTTNPAYPAKLAKSDRAYLHQVIDEVVHEVQDDDKAADCVYQQVSKRVVTRFLPLYEQSGGTCGFVTMQGDPRLDDDPDKMMAEARHYRSLGPNVMAKIPVTQAGIQAIEAAVEADIPICATEVFSLAQAVAVCERYQQASERTGNRPPFFVTHISGIFDEYLGKLAARERIEIVPEVLAQAGCAVARKEYRLLKARRYPGVLLGGGARDLHHFTEMVGGDVHVTINWSTAQQLIESDRVIESRIDAQTDEAVIDELSEKFEDFRLAYDEDQLPLEAFAQYGPVQLFRNAFLKGYYLLLAEIASRRHALAL
jgi:transaldolase